jgi:hypothetical protein
VTTSVAAEASFLVAMQRHKCEANALKLFLFDTFGFCELPGSLDFGAAYKESNMHMESSNFCKGHPTTVRAQPQLRTVQKVDTRGKPSDY